MELSKRLRSIADLIKEKGVVADIGCDHAFTDIYLIQNNISLSAIAMDVNKGPLEKALVHINEYGLSDKIELRLSNGFEKLRPNEADSVIISGMGGILIRDILKAKLCVTHSIKEFVLSPQSDQALVREFLLDNNIEIDYEKMVFDGGKFYNIIHANNLFNKTNNLKKEYEDIALNTGFSKDFLYEYGGYFLINKDDVFIDFVEKEIVRIENILRLMEENNALSKGELQKKKLDELKKYKGLLEGKKWND